LIGQRRGASEAFARLACALIALSLALPGRAAIPCPDPATVRAARLIEFQAMMMNVSVRCNHVGVALADPLSAMSSTQAVMFQDAHNKVRALLLAVRSDLSAPVKPGTKSGAAASRRADPLDRYITMAGNRYGGGSTTPDRCRAFKAIATSLSEPGSGGKLLTTVADSLIAQTILEKITGCAAKP
jgi:hypothetical protein